MNLDNFFRKFCIKNNLEINLYQLDIIKKLKNYNNINFGNSFFSKFLNIYVDQSIGMPAIEVMIISSILKQDNEVYYTRNLKDEKILDCDYVIFPSSIIAHETELSTLSKLENKKIFVTGIFANTMKERYLKNNSIVVKNESDIFFIILIKTEN